MPSDNPINNRYNADDLVEMILIKYSSPTGDETHCSKSELKRELVRMVDGIMRSEREAWETHESWMRMQRLIMGDQRPFLQKMFGKAS